MMTTARLLRYARKQNAALEKNGQHQLAARHALLHFPSGSIYSFIPKNGCSTLRLSLAIGNGALAKAEEFAWIHNNNQTFSASLPQMVCAPYAFVILRCPFKRLASAFLDKIVGRTPEHMIVKRMLKDQLDPASFSFRDFVAFLSAGRNVSTNLHWRPQSDFLVFEDYDDWFCLSQMEDAAKTIQRKCGLEIVDARKWTNHGTDSHVPMEPGMYADLSLIDIEILTRDGRYPRHEDLYDEDLIQQVRRLYKRDIDLYSDRIGPDGLTF